MRARMTWIAIFTTLIVVVPALPALACSCAYGDPREQLANADGAFIGTLISQTETDPPDPDEPVTSDRDNTYTFTVEEAIKGDIGGTIEVHAPADGASCGLEMAPGQQDGLFLYMRDGLWYSGLCLRIDPQELRDAAASLPEPDGENPARFLIGGSYGEARVVAVDEQGRTLAYGYGQKDTSHIKVCPGSRFSVEAVYTRRQPSRITIRDLTSFEVVRDLEIEGWDEWGTRKKPGVMDVLCRTEDADDILVLGSSYHDPLSVSELLKITPDGITSIHKGTAMSGTLTMDAVYVNQGRSGRTIAVIDPDTGAAHKIAKLDPFATPYPSPDGKWIATIYNDFEEFKKPSKITLVSKDGSKTRTAKLGKRGRYATGSIVWPDSETPVFLPYNGDTATAKVFDLELDVASTFDWYAGSPIIWGGSIYGIDFEFLNKSDLSQGSSEQVSELLFPVNYTLALIPDGATIEP